MHKLPEDVKVFARILFCNDNEEDLKRCLKVMYGANQFDDSHPFYAYVHGVIDGILALDKYNRAMNPDTDNDG